MKESERDTTIEEIHRIRAAIAKKFDYDMSRIIEDARKRQDASGRPIWRGPPAKLETQDNDPVAQS